MLLKLVLSVVATATSVAAFSAPASCWNHPQRMTQAAIYSRPPFFTHEQSKFLSPMLVRSSGTESCRLSRFRPAGSRSSFPKKSGLVMQAQPDEDTAVDEMTHATAVRNTAIAVGAAAAFGAGIGLTLGLPKMLEFFTGYIVEESLSVDNLFVFILLFQYFKVPQPYQQKVLRWGIIGAALLRGIFISAGLVAVQSFKAVLLVFAGFLIFSSYKILTGMDDDEEEDLSENAAVKLASRLVKSTTSYDGDNFFTLVDGVKRATPLLLVLVCVEFSDIMFAVDSIPAVFGVTEDPLIVLSSNLFAVLGLRALFQIVSNVMKDLQYLEQAVGLVLGFVGLKMVGGFAGLEVPPAESLAVIMSLLGGGVGLSYMKMPSAEEGEPSGGGGDDSKSAEELAAAAAAADKNKSRDK